MTSNFFTKKKSKQTIIDIKMRKKPQVNGRRQ